jgi:hypothetical protein
MVSLLRRIWRPEPPSLGRIGVASPNGSRALLAVIHGKPGAMAWNDWPGSCTPCSRVRWVVRCANVHAASIWGTHGTPGDRRRVGRVDWFECRLGLCDVVARALSVQRSAKRIDPPLSGRRGIKTLLSVLFALLVLLNSDNRLPADDIIACCAWISSSVVDLLPRPSEGRMLRARVPRWPRTSP